MRRTLVLRPKDFEGTKYVGAFDLGQKFQGSIVISKKVKRVTLDNLRATKTITVPYGADLIILGEMAAQTLRFGNRRQWTKNRIRRTLGLRIKNSVSATFPPKSQVIFIGKPTLPCETTHKVSRET